MAQRPSGAREAMSVTVHAPRGFDGERIVMQQMRDAFRIRHADTEDEAKSIVAAWKRNDFAEWPGDLRFMPSMDMEKAVRIIELQTAIVKIRRQIAAGITGDRAMRVETCLRTVMRQREEEIAKLLTPCVREEATAG
jgi:hypothetical protein